MADSYAILPSSMGKKPVTQKQKPDAKKYMPSAPGALLLQNPQEEECPYTFSDSPAYLRSKKEQEAAKRAGKLEGQDETRGFLRSVEEFGRTQKWEEALQWMEKRTSVTSGLFLVTRAMLRWKFCFFGDALRDAEEALRSYGGSAKAAPLAAAFACFARICLGSEARDQGVLSREMRAVASAWGEAEQRTLEQHCHSQSLFRPRVEERLLQQGPLSGLDGVECHDGTYVASQGFRIGYVMLKNVHDEGAPVVLHFHGPDETAADYRRPDLARRYRDLPAHLLVVDYRGYGWSGGQPSLGTCLRDAELLAEQLGELFIGLGLPWPYSGGLVISGRSLGAHVAVHMAALYPELFRATILDSATATSTCGDRLGRAPERAAALERWRSELADASLEVLQPIAGDMCSVSDLEKIRCYKGALLVLHGIADEVVPYDGSESLHMAARAAQKELVLVEGAGHDDLRENSTYWDAQRRFCLKIQLESTLPSIGGHVQHLCAICAEKAASKCGRCQKVWYCSRKHQAEHWKTHKAKCVGGPPEPRAAPAEADACIIAAVGIEVCTDRKAEDLMVYLNSLVVQQPQTLRAVYVGWHSPSDAITERLRADLEAFRAKCAALSVQAEVREAICTRRTFQHLKETLSTVWASVPGHSWVILQELTESRELWSPKRAAALLPALRVAAADARVVALRCGRHARSLPSPRGGSLPADGGGGGGGATPASQGSTAMVRPGDAAAVDSLLKSGAAELIDGAETRLADVVVRLKTLQTFLGEEKLGVLAHDLCAYRFAYKLSHAFGKKVQDFRAADGEWMRWSQPDYVEATAEDEFDIRKGEDLWQLVNQAQHRLHSEVEAALAIRTLRRAIERSLIQSAGEKLQAKDLRSLETEHANDFLRQCGLDEVIGLRKWVRDTASEISESALQSFGIITE